MGDGALTYRPAWNGIHHVALMTQDLDATIHFYQDVLGMDVLFVAPEGASHGRHCAVRPGGADDRLGLHFFEYARAPQIAPDARPLEALVFDPGPTFLSHLSFTLPDESAGVALRERLLSFYVPASPIMAQGLWRSVGFLDNNGMALEAIWPAKVSGARAADRPP